MTYDDNKAEAYVIIFSLFFVVCVLSDVYAFKIIPEDPYENESLKICSTVYNSTDSNNTLDCLKFFVQFKESAIVNYTNISEQINSSIHEIFNKTLNEEDVKEIIENETGNLSQFITYSEYDEIKKRLKDELVQFIKDNIGNLSVDADKQAERDHEFRMEQLKLGASGEKPEEEEPSEVSQSGYTEAQVQTLISEAVSKANPPQPQPIVNKSLVDKDVFSWDVAIILIMITLLVGFGFKALKNKFWPKKPYERYKDRGYDEFEEVEEKYPPKRKDPKPQYVKFKGDKVAGEESATEV